MSRFPWRYFILTLVLVIVVFGITLLAFPAWTQSYGLLLMVAGIVASGVVGFVANLSTAFEPSPIITPPTPVVEKIIREIPKEFTMAETKRPLRVFLCHASSDKPVVQELYERLIGDGVDAWLDKEKLVPGQDWQLEIQRAVKNSDVVIVCLSAQSITKEGYVQKEIRIALDAADEKPEGTIFIIPAKLEACDVPDRMNKFQWVNLFSDDGYGQLLKALKLRASDVDATIHSVKSLPKEISDLTSLMILVEHQRQRTYQVRYEFLIVSGDDQHLAIIHALREKGPDVETAEALVKGLERASLKLWSREDYIDIVDGDIANRHGIFRLLPKATRLIVG
jgi:hypothetical protein